MHRGFASPRGEPAHGRRRAFGFRHVPGQLADHVAQPVNLLLARDVAVGAARVLDVLLPLRHLPDALPGPAGFHIWTEKMIELRRGLSSSTTSTGVFEYTPPSQYGSPSILIAGNAGGSAPGS